MKITCDVIQDILPLYVENLASNDTRKIVEEHIQTCKECQTQFEKMSSSKPILPDADIGPLKKIKFQLQKKKILSIAFTVLITFTFLMVAFIYLTSPQYLPYQEDLVRFEENSIGQVIVNFRDDVTGYFIHGGYDEELSGNVYHITAWNTTWDEWFGHAKRLTTILNREGDEKIDSIYYYGPDLKEDLLIYGKDLIPNGGVTTLPRLALNYYFIVAGIATVLIGSLLLIFRKRESFRRIMEKVFFIPLSYCVSHLIVNGFGRSTYYMERDFLVILLIAFPLYGVFQLMLRLIRHFGFVK